MPRPGPRPYECVRRAWHSDRHQPMRGLIIQQIFRRVHENHSAATKENKEWQEKLPIVVFKAEEIMYSKANSEAEYSNDETLWVRVNDAVDTIIRRDGGSETGELLPPCVEAALNLGCVPVRASRSQRLNNPRTYLRPAYQECSHVSQRYPNNNAMQQQHSSNLMPSQISSYSMPGFQNVGPPHLIWEGSTRNIDSPVEKFRPSVTVEDRTSFSRPSVYPLYYGMSLRPEGCPSGIQEVLKSPDPIIVGVPIYSSPEPAEGGQCLQNLFPCGQESNRIPETLKLSPMEDKDKGKQPRMDFDLSLRLGSFANTNTSRVGVTEKSKEEFRFFPMEPSHGWLHMSEGGNQSADLDLVSRKRKLPFNADVVNDQIFGSWDSSSFHFGGQWRSRGL